MRPRQIVLAGALVWVAFVGLVSLTTDVGAAEALLIGSLGILGLGVLGVQVLMFRQLQRIERNVARASAARAAKAKGPLPKLARRDVERVADAVRRDLAPSFRRAEALQRIHAMLPIQHSLPAFGSFPATPDLIVLLLDLVDRHRPKVIVECGSGLSTLCFALALREFGIDGKVIALEHLEKYAAETRDLLDRHGVADFADVRTAPLEEYQVGSETTRWYGRDAWADLSSIDLLLIDGPPATLGPLARYPAFPHLLSRLSPDGHALLDDFARDDEQAILERWEAENPGTMDVVRVPLERGAALITPRRTA